MTDFKIRQRIVNDSLTLQLLECVDGTRGQAHLVGYCRISCVSIGDRSFHLHVRVQELRLGRDGSDEDDNQ